VKKSLIIENREINRLKFQNQLFGLKIVLVNGNLCIVILQSLAKFVKLFGFLNKNKFSKGLQKYRDYNNKKLNLSNAKRLQNKVTKIPAIFRFRFFSNFHRNLKN
jgi:hypothetical protein